MRSEDTFRRVPPTVPYRPGTLVLRVPKQALAATVELLQRAGKKESGVLWYGPRDSAGNGTVVYVVAPRQEMSWGNYHISAEELARVVHGLSGDWKPLAQVHSHPGILIEHSPYDDRMAISTRVLSLVFPNYGRKAKTFPTGIGVHECQDGYWHLLNPATARRRIIVTGGEVKVEDFR